MSVKKICQRYSLIAMLWVVFFIAACVPIAAPEPMEEPGLITEPLTPTPEIFNPVNPSPTSSGSTLPMTCQVTDLNVYINEEWGYCFAYPAQYALDETQAAEGIVSLYGPALDDFADPVRVSLEITTRPVPEGSKLASLVDAYLTLFANTNMPVVTTREPSKVGSENAEKVEPIPGLLSSRVILALHDNLLFTLRFHPSDIDYAKPDLDALTQTVTGSFAFLEGTTPPASRKESVNWSEFGKNITLIYDSSLAPWVEAQSIPAVPMSDQVLFAESRPTYAQFRFAGYQGGRPYQLPLLPIENHIPQVMVFRTADFPGDDSATGFVNQLQELKDLVTTGLDPAICAQPSSGEFALPFLPWLNYHQTFCSQPQILAFPGGKGVRYLTFYSQGPNPVLDQHVFYTFQGVTDDGEFYVSAAFPVETGIFPTEPSPCPKCGEPDYNPLPEWQALLSEQLTQLNAQDAEQFEPSLMILDELIQSIQIDD
jgi:hypothetical protein